MATSQDFVNWVCSEAIHPPFLVKLLLAESRALRRFSKGTVHRTIYFPEVKAFYVCLPSVAEQQRIVARVDQLMRLLDVLEDSTAKRERAAIGLAEAATTLD
jgi:type I restriction enzyme S subunit